MSVKNILGSIAAFLIFGSIYIFNADLTGKIAEPSYSVIDHEPGCMVYYVPEYMIWIDVPIKVQKENGDASIILDKDYPISLLANAGTIGVIIILIVYIIIL